MRLLYLLILFCTLVTAGSVMGQSRPDYDLDQAVNHGISKTVQIFPNPAVEFVHVRLDHANVGNVKVTIHNIIGNEISADTERIDEHEIRIRVKDFDAGYYLLALEDDRSHFRGTYKFLKR